MAIVELAHGVTSRLLCLTKPRNSVKYNEAKAVDIIAIHGLDAPGSGGSWTTQDGTLWLRDLLPRDIPSARAFSFDYDAKALFTRHPMNIESVARNLLAALATRRKDVPCTRPLVLVGHGFGGFIVEAVVNYTVTHPQTFPDITTCLKKVIFLSTPQRSSPEIPWKTLLVNSAKESLYGLNSSKSVDIDILTSIEHNAQSFQKVRADFRKHAISLKIKVLTCYEGVLTPPQQTCTVTELSSTLALKAEKLHRMSGCNHLFTARFSDREDENYKSIISAIKKVVKGSAQTTEPITTAPGLPVPDKKPQVQSKGDNTISVTNSSVKVAGTRLPNTLPLAPTVRVEQHQIPTPRGDISQQSNVSIPRDSCPSQPRPFSTFVVTGTTTTASAQLASQNITQQLAGKVPQRPSLPSSLSIQAPTRQLSITGIESLHDALPPQHNAIPDILKPRSMNLDTHSTTTQSQPVAQSTPRPLSTSTVTASWTGTEKQGSSQGFIPYRPFTTGRKPEYSAEKISTACSVQTYKPFRPVSMQMPVQRDQRECIAPLGPANSTQHIGTTPIPPIREPASIPRSTFPTRSVVSGTTIPSILTSGRDANKGPQPNKELGGQTFQGTTTHTGLATIRGFSTTTVEPPIPRSIQPANPTIAEGVVSALIGGGLSTASAPSGHKLSRPELPGSLTTQDPSSIRNTESNFFHPGPRELTTAGKHPVLPGSVAPSAVKGAVSAPPTDRGINIPSLIQSSAGAPKPMAYRGAPVQSSTAPSRIQNQHSLPKSLEGITRPPKTTTTGSRLPALSPHLQPKQGFPMRSSISEPQAAHPSRIQGSTSGGPRVGPPQNFGPRGVPSQSQPSKPPLNKVPPPCYPGPGSPVPAPPRGPQTGPALPRKPPGIFNELSGTSKRLPLGTTKGQQPASRGAPNPNPSGQYTPYRGPTGNRPKPSPGPPPSRGPAYHPSPHANGSGNDMSWMYTHSQSFHHEQLVSHTQYQDIQHQGLNSLYYSGHPIPPSQPQRPPDQYYLQLQSQLQSEVQVHPAPGNEHSKDKKSSSSGLSSGSGPSSTIKIAAGVVAGAAIGGLATAGIVGALQKEEQGESKENTETNETVQLGPEDNSPVSGSVSGEDIGPGDAGQQRVESEIETETSSESEGTDVSTPGSTSSSDNEGVSSDDDEGDYTDGYDDDSDGDEHGYDDDEHYDENVEDGDTSDRPDYDSDDQCEDKEVESTYEEDNQYEDNYHCEDEEEDEAYTYEGEDDYQEGGDSDYEYQGQSDDGEPENDEDDEDEVDGQPYESENEYQEGENSDSQYEGHNIDSDSGDESEQGEQAEYQNEQSESEDQETEYPDNEYEAEYHDSESIEYGDEDEEYQDEYQPDYQQQYEPEYQQYPNEYQAEDEVEYEPEGQFDEQSDYGDDGSYEGEGYGYDQDEYY